MQRDGIGGTPRGRGKEPVRPSSGLLGGLPFLTLIESNLAPQKSVDEECSKLNGIFFLHTDPALSARDDAAIISPALVLVLCFCILDTATFASKEITAIGE
jgi:hypothetical protein